MDDIRIARGETLEGLFWIVVYQYGKAELRCQHIETWIDKDLGEFFEANADKMTLQEIEQVLKN